MGGVEVREVAGVGVAGAATALGWSPGVGKSRGGSGLSGEPLLTNDLWFWSGCCALPCSRRQVRTSC